MSTTPSFYHSDGGHPYEFVPGTTIREPIDGREIEYRPWEAPPTLSARESLAVAHHQGEVVNMQLELLQNALPANLPPVTIDAIAAHIMPESGKAYQGNHERSLMQDPAAELGPSDLAIHHKVNIGTANMAEIAHDFEKTQRRTGELAILRVIAGHRAEHVDAMMAELMVLLGENFSDGGPRKFRVMGFDNNYLRNAPMESITLGYKRYYGRLGDSDTEVDSRHSFVLRTDKASGFDSNLRDAMQKASRYDHTHVPALTRVGEVLQEVIAAGPSHPLVAAATIKLYLFNREVDRKIAERDALKEDPIIDSAGIFFEDPDEDDD